MMIDLVKARALRRFHNALKNLPQRGEGLHSALMSICNQGVAARLTENELIETISAVDRAFKTGEVEDAVAKALADAEDWTSGTRTPKPRTPMSKAVAAGRILAEDKKRAAKLQVALIEKGGGSVDPFSSELRAMSTPQFELVPAIPGIEGSEHRRDMLVFLRTFFESNDYVYVGNARESKATQRYHIKTRDKWTVFFECKLNEIDSEPDPREQRRKLIALGDRFGFTCVNSLSGFPNDQGSFRSNSNVKRYSFALVESDSLPLEQQIALMRGLRLPVKSLVFSGGKSIHALVDVARIPGGESVKDQSTWDLIVKKNFFGQVAPLGFDKATSNSARICRLPGLLRSDTGKFQQLLYMNQNGDPLQ